VYFCQLLQDLLCNLICVSDSQLARPSVPQSPLCIRVAPKCLNQRLMCCDCVIERRAAGCLVLPVARARVTGCKNYWAAGLVSCSPACHLRTELSWAELKWTESNRTGTRPKNEAIMHALFGAHWAKRTETLRKGGRRRGRSSIMLSAQLQAIDGSNVQRNKRKTPKRN